MSEWKPIETAPKDGSAVVVFCPDAIEPQIVVAHCLTFDGDPDGPEWWDVWNESAPSLSSETPPTHWMPLPNPPEEAS